MGEKEINIKALLDLTFAVPGDAVYKNGQLFGCITGFTEKGVMVALDRDVQKLISAPEIASCAVKVTSIEITQFELDVKAFEVFARDPFPEFPDDEKWAEEFYVDLESPF